MSMKYINTSNKDIKLYFNDGEDGNIEAIIVGKKEDMETAIDNLKFNMFEFEDNNNDTLWKITIKFKSPAKKEST